MKHVINPDDDLPLTHILQQYKQQLDDLNERFLGYPTNTAFDYTPLLPFFSYTLNNVGDPFADSPYLLNSRRFEREVIHFFARLYGLSEEEGWGYVTNGGTEGNMHGLLLAREKFANGVIYLSEDTHYSVKKIAHILNIPFQVIRSQPHGEIDYADLLARLTQYNKKPAILCLNIGTTMKGATDDLKKVLPVLEQAGVQKYYIHCDCALFGMILPFIEGSGCPTFDLPIDSVAISGHKFIGSPIPCGIALTRKKNVTSAQHSVEYVGVPDTTITGSRNALTPLILWYAVQTRGYAGFKTEVQTCIQNAQYLYTELKKRKQKPLLNPFSTIVYFRIPNDTMQRKWQLAPQQGYTHIVVMQHVTRDKIDKFLGDLDASL